MTKHVTLALSLIWYGVRGVVIRTKPPPVIYITLALSLIWYGVRGQDIDPCAHRDDQVPIHPKYQPRNHHCWYQVEGDQVDFQRFYLSLLAEHQSLQACTPSRIPSGVYPTPPLLPPCT